MAVLPDCNHQGQIFAEPSDMANSQTACVDHFNFSDYAAAGIEPPNLARHKLDRLRELRAVIDTLRHECESRDPLLAWILEREYTENH
jgi:hypothetical protein